MDIKESYVLSTVLGHDLSSVVSSFIHNPEEESRTIRDNARIWHLDNCYDKYRNKEIEEVLRMQRILSTRNCDYDTILDIREQINDIYYGIESITYVELMEIYPRMKLYQNSIWL